MKIILKGTETELINMLGSFGIPNEVVFDNGSQFLCGDIAGRGHGFKKAEHTFKELKAKIKDEAKDFSADGKNVSRPPEMIEFAERNKIEIPDYIAKQEYVDGKLLAKAIKEAPIIEVSQTMRNMTLSELLYLLTYKKSRKD